LTIDPKTQSAAVDGSISGYTFDEYSIQGKQGQALTLMVKQKAQHGALLLEAVVFSINGHPPSRIIAAWKNRRLDESGEYVIRVLMPRTYARKNLTAAYTLVVTLN
jgi:hypothetical protein